MEDISHVLLRFNRLLRDLESGYLPRNSYRPWEVELLLDFQSCDISSWNRKRLLDRYQRAVQRALERGASRPLKLSEYLDRLRSRNYNRKRPAARKTA